MADREMSNLIPKLEFVAQSLVKKQSFCPHCAWGNFNQIYKKYGVIKIQECQNCNLCFTDPIYQPLLTSSLYDHLYAAEGSTTRLPNQDELATLKKNLFQSSDKYFGDRLRKIKLLIAGKKMLEIGSSWGYFLYQAQHHGFEATGVEISNRRRLFGIRNLEVNIVESMDSLKGGLFDLVYTSHVLEHFTDISTIFVEIHNLLIRGGELIIEVPNFDISNLREGTLSMIGAVHPLGFSSLFFQKNLPKYGFKILGFYEDWDSFPEGVMKKSNKNVIILRAQKEG
jgi:SAM-dependent methyltransferase